MKTNTDLQMIAQKYNDEIKKTFEEYLISENFTQFNPEIIEEYFKNHSSVNKYIISIKNIFKKIRINPTPEEQKRCDDFCKKANAIYTPLLNQYLASKNQPEIVTNRLQTQLQALSEADKEAVIFGKNPEIIEEIVKDYETAGVADERNLCLLSYIAATSRLMDEPLNILIQATSGTGKSFIQKNTMQFIPPEDVVNASSLTAKAISNMDQTALKHKILCIGEAEGIAHLYPLRVLIDGESYDTKKTVGSSTQTTKIEGPVSVHVTNAEWKIDQQTESRFFILETHQSEAHNCNVQKAQCLVGSLEGWKLKQQTNKKIAVHHAFQKSLKPYIVHNDISKAEYFGNKQEASLRQHQHFLDLCKAVCFLHQHQRPFQTIDGENHIFVTIQDIEIAVKLVSEIYGFSLDCLKPAEMKLLKFLHEFLPKGQHRMNTTFTMRIIEIETKIPYSTLDNYIKALIKRGLVVKDGRKQGVPQFRLFWDGSGLDGKKISLDFQYNLPALPSSSNGVPSAFQGVSTPE